MGKPFQIDRSFALTALTVLGMLPARAREWPGAPLPPFLSLHPRLFPRAPMRAVVAELVDAQR